MATKQRGFALSASRWELCITGPSPAWRAPQSTDNGGMWLCQAEAVSEASHNDVTTADESIKATISKGLSKSAGVGQAASFTPFDLEEWQSRYEHSVKYNLADSGCHPVQLSELVADPAAVEKLLSLDLHYPPVRPPPVLMILP